MLNFLAVLIALFGIQFVNHCNGQVKDTLIATKYFDKAVELFKQNKKQESIRYFNQAAEINNATGRWKVEAACYLKLSNVYFGLMRYDSSIMVAKKVLSMPPSKLAAESLEKAYAMQRVGDALIYKSDYSGAFEYYQKALPIFEKLLTVKNYELAEFYFSLSQVYYYNLDQDRDIQYKLKALEILKVQLGPDHVKVGAMYDNLANSYITLKDFTKALEYIAKAIAIFKKQHGEQSPDLVFAYHRMAEVYTQKGELKKALNYLQIGESINKGKDVPGFILNKRGEGQVYYMLGNFQASITSYSQSLAVALKAFGPRHPATTSVYSSRALAYLKAGLERKAIEDFHLSIISISKSFNNTDPYSLPAADDFTDFNIGLGALLNKANGLWKIYNKDRQLNDLNACLKTYQLADTILNNMRFTRLTYTDKVRMGRFSVDIYEGAIGVALELNRITNEFKYKELAFYFSQRSKSKVLDEILVEAAYKNSGDLPQNVINKERDLKNKVTRLKSDIQKFKSKNEDDSEDLKAAKESLLKYERTLDSLKNEIVQNKPVLAKLMNENQVIKISQLKTALPGGTIFLEYFEGDTTLYLFGIFEKSFVVKTIKKDSAYDKSLDDMRSTFESTDLKDIYSNDGYNRFVTSSNRLYNILLADVLNEVKNKNVLKNLVIIPDGRLCYVPFEILTISKPDQKSDYSKLNYLIKNYSVVYGYSAKLHFSDSAATKRQSGKGLISFAPSYKSLHELSQPQIAAIGKFRDKLYELKWNQLEGSQVADLYGGEKFLEREATEEKFKLLTADKNIIHLAMHALIDDDDPMNSKLVFETSASTEEDGLLHIFELYNMKLRAQLVVLSACNTGYGQLARGEGVLSLGRAFAYTGVPSVVISQWNVDDEATSKLMEKFYSNLKQGLTKSDAMKKAKLDYLTQADPAKTHPFFWGAFIVMGNDSPVEQETSYINYGAIILLILISAVVIAFLIYKKRLVNSI